MARRTKEEAQRTRQQLLDAARVVFHRNGVARSTLEQVASEAGVSRGAIYWHFKNKAELFFALRTDVLTPLFEQMDATFQSDHYPNPLDALEVALKATFEALDNRPQLRQMLEIMVLRCESVAEFAAVRQEADRPSLEFLGRVEQIYREAAAGGYLCPAADPAALAWDTWAFVGGLLHALLAGMLDTQLQSQVASMVSHHIALRRARQ